MNPPSLVARINEAIRAHELLSKLRATARENLIAGARVQEVDREATICCQGASAQRFWLVLEGEVKLVKYSTKGVPLLLDILLPNRLFGALFYPHQPVYPWAALAVRRTKLVSFRLKDFVHDLEDNPPLQRLLLRDTSYKLCQAQQMRALWLEEAPVRIAHALLYLHEKFGLVIPETRAILAELSGTSVETAIRITNDLVRRGILTTRRGQIEILSLSGLRASAEGLEPARTPSALIPNAPALNALNGGSAAISHKTARPETTL